MLSRMPTRRLEASFIRRVKRRVTPRSALGRGELGPLRSRDSGKQWVGADSVSELEMCTSFPWVYSERFNSPLLASTGRCPVQDSLQARLREAKTR